MSPQHPILLAQDMISEQQLYPSGQTVPATQPVGDIAPVMSSNSLHISEQSSSVDFTDHMATPSSSSITMATASIISSGDATSYTSSNVDVETSVNGQSVDVVTTTAKSNSLDQLNVFGKFYIIVVQCCYCLLILCSLVRGEEIVQSIQTGECRHTVHSYSYSCDIRYN